MRDPIVLPCLTYKGEQALFALIASTRKVEDPRERCARRDEILADPELAFPHPSGIMIDRAAVMTTAMEVGDELYHKLAPLGVSGMVAPGVNAGLLAVYIDQMVGATSKRPNSYFLSRHGAMVRNYRNAFYVHFRFYMEHLKNPGGTATILLENCPASKIINPMEKLAQQPGILAAPALLDFVGVSMLNDKGKFVRPPKKETGGELIKAEKALQEFTVVITQAGKNYDIPEMTTPQVVPLIPETPLLAFYKRRAKKALATRSRAQKALTASA